MRYSKLPGIVILLGCLLALIVTDTLAQVEKKRFVDIIDGSTAQGRVITIELQTSSGSTVASTTYTTQSGDTDEDVAGALVANFSGNAGYTVTRGKDKPGGTEVLIFRATSRVASFVIVITNNSDLVISESAGYSRMLARSMSIFPSLVSVGSGTAVVQFTGTNTQWMDPPPFNVTGVEFDDQFTVTNFEVLSNTQAVAEVSWNPLDVGFLGVHVLMIGDDLEDDPGSTPLAGIAHDVSDELFTLFIPQPGPSVRAPGLSRLGFVLVGIVILVAGAIVIRRRVARI